jgi:methylmalonyl-CoA mutase cobalamin-binding domain/chain
MKIRDEIEKGLLANDRSCVREILIFQFRNMPPLDRIDRLVAPVLDTIGMRWERGEVSLSQVYLGTKLADELVEEIIGVSDVARKKVPVLAISVLEDHHLLGLKVVKMTMQSAGYDVIDYGRTTVEELVDAVERDHVRYLLISTLMLRSALLIKNVRELLDANGLDVVIIAGGAPFRFDAQLSRKVGANLTTASPIEALDYIRNREGGE